MKTAISNKPRIPIVPRASSLHTALTASLFMVPILFTATPVGAVQFSVTNLGTLWGTASSATGINAAGQVVGWAYTSGDAAIHAFLWQSGSMQDLGTFGGTYSYATGINAAGQVVGNANTIGASHAFLWQPGSMQDLGTFGGTDSRANAINATGQVVGYAYTTGNAAQRAFLWQSGSMQDLGTLGGTYSSASGINAAGQVVGNAYTSGDAVQRAFLWQHGSMQDLGALGGRNSYANGINAAGQVVGYAHTSGDVANRAFLWQSGSMQDLGTLGGTNSYANGINAAGQVVGNATTSGDAANRAFLRGAQGGMTDLNTLLVAGSGATVTVANAVNDLGQIVGNATIAGQTRAVLLTPGGSLAWLGSGAGGNFSDGANWELGFSPSKFLDAVIASTGSQTIYASVDATVKSLSLGGVAGSGGRPQLVLQYGANLTALNSVTVQATGTLAGDGKITGNVINLGSLQANNLSVTGTLSNAGLVNGSGYLNANLTNTASGQVRSGAGEYLRVVGTAHSNAGTLDINGGGTQQYTGSLTNATGGRILLNNAVLRADNGLSNAGQVQVSYGGATVYGPITTTSGGKIILSGNSNTTFYDALDIQSGGELRVSKGSTGVFFGQVNQRSGATFSGAGSKFYEGGLSIGGSPGYGSDGGDVNFGSGNVYLEEIGGLGAGTEFDKYVVAGNLSFGGTLKLKWWEGFTGEAGQTFDIFDWGTTDGAFSTLDFSGAKLAEGLVWDTSKLYLTGEISVTAVPEPESWAMLLAGLGLVGGAARRARRI